MNFLSDDVLTTGAGLNTGTNTGGIEGLLQNKLFLQYLSGAGSALQQGQPVAPALDKITNQSISAQNYAKLLSKLLGSDESKGTFSNKGLNLTIPASELKSGAFLGDNPLGNPLSTTSTQTQALTSSSSPAPSPSINPNQMGVVNPFAGSPLRNISASDLAGLTTQDLSTILSGALSVEQLKQKKVSDVIDSMYKQAQISKMEKGDSLDQAFPVDVPGVGKVTHRQWSTMPDKEKQYALFVNMAKQLGDKDIMSKEEYESYVDSLKPNERTRFLKDLLKDPKLMQAEKSLRQAGATNISLDTKLTEKKAMSDVETRNYFAKGEHITDLNKHMEKADFANVPGKAGSAEYIANVANAKANEGINFIKSKILAGGGTLAAPTRFEKDGKTMVWTVKWPDGEVKEIRAGVR